MHTVATTYTNLICITSHIFMQVLLITSSLLFLWVYSYSAAALYYMHSMDKMDVDQPATLVLEIHLALYFVQQKRIVKTWHFFWPSCYQGKFSLYMI